MTPEQIAQLTELSAKFDMLGKVNAEILYWWCTALMVSIHAGFLAYEMGASRIKNTLAAGVKNILAFAFLVPTFYLFGWFIYNAFPTGFTISETGWAALAWSSNMGPNLTDSASGIFWAAFTMFAATTASIMSGSVIERITVGAFIILAIALGAFVWILGAAWGWHPAGWLTTEWGFHDTAAAGCVHTIAGFFTLGVLINLGPRIGRFLSDGRAVDIPGHNVPLSLIGLMLIIMGFFGFLGGCIIYVNGGQWVTIFNTPTTLSAFAFNTLMGFGGGVLGAYFTTREPFWMMSGALAGIIACAAGLEIYYPPLAFAIAFFTGATIPLVANFVTRMGIDDAVGAVAVHGYSGVVSLLAAGIFLAGYPNVAEGAPPVNFLGQLGSAVVMVLLGFVPGYLLSLLLKVMGILRVPEKVEVMGLDIVKVPSRPYPEGPGVPVGAPAE
ncbi:ammonium transporter [Zavarzinia sp. CC-PAN008]|uniref:ammonium transporter n=1 Tax=Zavarzinia sp. CC-PAN008 TaxID=3243332 RepID=UPI003F7485A1